MSESNMSISEMLTYSTVLINCQYADGSVGSGTGFFINHKVIFDYLFKSSYMPV